MILAIVFLFAIALVLISVGGLTANSLVSTNNLKSLRTTEANVEAATTVAIRYVRTTYTPAIYAGTLQSCPSPGATGTVVWCKGTTSSTGIYTRTVDFYACPSGTTSANCQPGNQALYLHATVQYSDFNFAGVDACSAATTATCGAGMNFVNWDVLRADG